MFYFYIKTIGNGCKYMCRKEKLMTQMTYQNHIRHVAFLSLFSVTKDIAEREKRNAMTWLVPGLDTVSAATIAVSLKNPWFLPALMAAIAFFQPDRSADRPQDVKESNMQREYDFIIVGAGSAGSVVANRLSEIGNWKILLLEAGGDETDLSDVPLFAGYLQHSDLDWDYLCEPNDGYCKAMNGGRCYWPRGKVLGGCSVLNFMLYVRGNKKDYDSWEAMGNKGWGYEDVLPYFKKSEDNIDFPESPYHGTGGYLTVCQPNYFTPLAECFVEAGKELGYENRDFNAEKQTGFMINQGTWRNGSRCSTAKAFLRPAAKRRNLHISMNSHVTRVLIDPYNKTAFGVEFVKNNKTYQVKARKEVIMSAGTINTAQLLMLSGIGRAQDLTKHGIPVIEELNVGQNLQDHVALGGLAFTLRKDGALCDNHLVTIDTIVQYAALGDGPLTGLAGDEGLAFINTKYVNASDDYPDIEFHFKSGSVSEDGGETMCKVQGCRDEFCASVFAHIESCTTWSILPMLLRPKSKGWIDLRSADPLDPPRIYPNYFADESDMKTLIEGVKVAMAISKTKPFQRYRTVPNPNIFPACKDIPRYSDAYYECMIRQYTATVYHLVGTAKMGPWSDPEAVVDDELRVYGIQRLRVIDGSIMPNVVSGNTNAPIIMIAEKGSDMIKDCWLRRPKS